MSDNAGPTPLERSRTRSSGAAAAASVRFLRRSSKNDRVNEILDNARDRADTLSSDAGPNDVAATSSPSLVGSPMMVRRDNPSSSMAIGDAIDEQSADESTRMVSGNENAGYQTLRTTEYDPIPSKKEPGIYAKRSQDLSQAQPTKRPEPHEEVRQRNSNSNAQSTQGMDGRPSWWKQTTERFRGVELENKGSVARDHLALERTFLAWLRTSLAFASIGIAVTQLFRLNTSLSDKEGPRHDLSNSTLRHMGKPLGATFLGISILTLLLGYRRYVESREWVIRGKFPASRGTIALIALVAFGIMIVSLVVVIVIHPTIEDEKDL